MTMRYTQRANLRAAIAPFPRDLGSGLDLGIPCCAVASITSRERFRLLTEREAGHPKGSPEKEINQVHLAKVLGMT
jgi:hypothetical protein